MVFLVDLRHNVEVSPIDNQNIIEIPRENALKQRSRPLDLAAAVYAIAARKEWEVERWEIGLPKAAKSPGDGAKVVTPHSNLT